jgi:1-acyl-sn-glycerol-3-phosphate acyltransferase
LVDVLVKLLNLALARFDRRTLFFLSPRTLTSGALQVVPGRYTFSFFVKNFCLSYHSGDCCCFGRKATASASSSFSSDNRLMHHAPTLRFVAAAAFAAQLSHSFTTIAPPYFLSAARPPRVSSTSNTRRFVAATPPPEDFLRSLVEQAQQQHQATAVEIQKQDFVALLSKKIEEEFLSPAAAAPAAVAPPPVEDPNVDDFVALRPDQAGALFRFGSGDSEKIINAFGLYCAAVSIVTGLIWMAAMSLVGLSINQQEKIDPHRAIFDRTGKVWAKVWLTLINNYPTITGNLQLVRVNKTKPAGDDDSDDPYTPGVTTCLYVANHASWLDIPVLCTVLDPVFKFIAKGELAHVPCVGQQLVGGQHILIDREDRRSQLKTFKEGMSYLRDKGVSLMAFPEGKRSKDGRLMEFKRGLFSLAVKAKVPIVPITISHTAAVMPSYSYFPVQRGNGRIHVHIGEAIHPDGKTESELEALVRAEFLAHLPASQRPLPAETAPPAVPARELQAV